MPGPLVAQGSAVTLEAVWSVRKSAGGASVKGRAGSRREAGADRILPDGPERAHNPHPGTTARGKN